MARDCFFSIFSLPKAEKDSEKDFWIKENFFIEIFGNYQKNIRISIRILTNLFGIKNDINKPNLSWTRAQKIFEIRIFILIWKYAVPNCIVQVYKTNCACQLSVMILALVTLLSVNLGCRLSWSLRQFSLELHIFKSDWKFWFRFFANRK